MTQFDGLVPQATTPPWNDDEEDPMNKAKRIKMEKDCQLLEQKLDSDKDHRQWTQQHLTAANILNDSNSMLALTPPENDQSPVPDIDVRGPDGFTPLMLASFRGGGYDTGDTDSSGSGSGSGDSNESDDRSGDYIQALLSQGASINLATDRTQETALHLAARYSRSDAAKILLDAGADPNQPDINGRTPLHAAVAADALGVFQVIMKKNLK